MDNIAASAATIKREKVNEPVLKIFPELTDSLKGCPRFLLDENAIATAVELSLGRPTVILEAIRNLRIPYPAMWVEWPERGREKLRTAFEDTYTSEERPVPERIGLFIEASDDGRRGKVTWAWNAPQDSYVTDFPNIAAISPYFDLDKETPQRQERIEGFLRGNLAKMWQDHPAQLEALFAIWRTADHRPNEWGWEYCGWLHDMGALEARLPELYADVYGEYIIVWTILLILTSSRTIVDYKPVDRSKLNKQRRILKRPPLFDHTEVTLHIGERHRDGQRGQPLGYKRKSPRIHMVSSFLNRRGDKHWIVQPFWRGEGETIHRQVKVKG